MKPAFLATILLLAAPSFAQDTPEAAFSDEKLETIAAPVALYPDSLLMQMFMASTYPLEVVEAQRWIEGKKLSAKDLDAALKDKSWDPSVKSLCAFPDVLKRMSENLDWTRDMGDAFLEQQSQLLDAVQRLRDKAYAAGQLKTTEQQVVTVKQDKIIVIEPAQPEVIYVPTYSPTVVYGTWPYPTTYYPALYAPPPAGYGALAFATGMVVGAAIWGNCNWGWGNSNCNVNVNNYNNFNRNTNNNFQQINNGKWEHNADHRKGVNYRDGKTAQKYGGSGAGNRVSRDEARGYQQKGGRDGAGAGSNRAGQGGGGARTNDARGGGSGGARTNDARGGGSAKAGGASKSKGTGSGGLSGSKNASMDRAASSRGSSSRGSSSGASRSSGGSRSSGASRSSGGRSGGGGSRGGGGGRGGGGRR